MNIRKLIEATRGKIFKVSFTKRTDGTKRIMCARLGVKRHLRGGSLSFEPKDHDLIVAFDMQKRGYRSIPCDAVDWFACGKTSWKRLA